MASEASLALELAPLDGGGSVVRIEWELEALRALAVGEGGPSAETRSPWRLEGGPDWERDSALRVVSAAFEDGALLAVAMLRPRGAEGHDADAVRAVLLPADAEAKQVHEVLVSTEYGPDGKTRRLGLELYEEPEGPPIRIAADRDDGTFEATGDGLHRELTAMTFEMEGKPGDGLHELIRAG